MAVNFNFTLNDTDTENLIDILQDAVNQAQEKYTEYCFKADQIRNVENVDTRNWWKGRLEYLTNLKSIVVTSMQKISRTGPS